MSATIICSEQIKNEIQKQLLAELKPLMKKIEQDEGQIKIEETETGLSIEYPIGEISKNAKDYVQDVEDIFKQLKVKHKDIGIYGIAYENEKTDPGLFGPLFHCSPEDEELIVTDDWQKCASCGSIVEGEAFYDSSYRSMCFGTSLCLCCPTCMLEYALDNKLKGLGYNEDFDDIECESILFDEDDQVIRDILWSRILENKEEYLEDFKQHKERVAALLGKDIPADKKSDLQNLIRDLD